MGRILVIAEKPSVGRDIGKVLGCTQRGNGFLAGEKYIVSWAVGHLITLCDPQDYDASLKKWRHDTLPIIPKNLKLKAIDNTKDQLNVLDSLMNDDDTESIICATDSGREGELIFRSIYTYVNCKKPFQRLWISSMTDAAIKDGFNNLKPSTEYDNLYYSAKCRSEADWLVGINASRAYTLKYDTLLSIGRVQTPTLGIITQRQKEINAFDVREYFEVIAEYGDFNGTWFLKEYAETKIFEKEKADAIAKKVTGTVATVEKIENEEKRQPSPLLFDLTELQRDCNKKFGFSAQKTLSVAQDLYEKRKMITYPRTDSRYLSDDMIPKVKNTLNKLKNVSHYGDYVEYVLNLPSLPFSKRIIDNGKVSDHHAIIPTDVNIKMDSLSVDEKNVYNLIALRFISVFYPAYVYNITRAVIASQEETFISKGNTIIDLGWMALYKNNQPQKTTKNEELVLPPLKEGETVNIVKAKSVKKKTQPPKLFTEASLLSAMENAGRFIEDEVLREKFKDSGLGTPATRAATIERLINVGYIVRKGKNLIPTEKALKIIDILPDQLKSPQTTGKWEKGLSSIAKGDMEDSRFMESINRFVHFLVDNAQNTTTNVVFESEKKPPAKGGLGKCPVCEDGRIFENSKSFFCSNWKQGCKFSVWKNSLDQYGNTVDSKKIQTLLKTGKVENLTFTLPQTGETGTGTLIFNKTFNGVEIMNLQH
ncbi:MAG: DNA topoisomerase III [Anaerotignaceae bacterium]